MYAATSICSGLLIQGVGIGRWLRGLERNLRDGLFRRCRFDSGGFGGDFTGSERRPSLSLTPHKKRQNDRRNFSRSAGGVIAAASCRLNVTFFRACSLCRIRIFSILNGISHIPYRQLFL